MFWLRNGNPIASSCACDLLKSSHTRQRSAGVEEPQAQGSPMASKARQQIWASSSHASVPLPAHGCLSPSAFQVMCRLFLCPALIQNAVWEGIVGKLVQIWLSWHAVKPLQPPALGSSLRGSKGSCWWNIYYELPLGLSPCADVTPLFRLTRTNIVKGKTASPLWYQPSDWYIPLSSILSSPTEKHTIESTIWCYQNSPQTSSLKQLLLNTNFFPYGLWFKK